MAPFECVQVYCDGGQLSGFGELEYQAFFLDLSMYLVKSFSSYFDLLCWSRAHFIKRVRVHLKFMEVTCRAKTTVQNEKLSFFSLLSQVSFASIISATCRAGIKVTPLYRSVTVSIMTSFSPISTVLSPTR